VIRLRRAIDRALANPWLRILVIGILAGLLALVFLHVIADGVHNDDDDVLICVAIVALLTLSFLQRPSLFSRRVSVPRRRGPPRPSLTRRLFEPHPPAVVIPLRR
jgi:hypothetical protein